MTDSEKFSLIERTKKRIKNMDLNIAIIYGKSIQVISDNFTVIWELNNFKVCKNTSEKNVTMDKNQWANYCNEIDNLDRAILWIDSLIKDIVLGK